MYPKVLRTRFTELWPRVLRESPPNPEGAVGELMALLEECLDVEQIQHAIVGEAASFLFDLSSLGFSGMGYNVLIVSPPPANTEEERWQADFLLEQKHAIDSIGFCFHLYLTNTRPERNAFVGTMQEAVFLGREDLEAIFSAQVPKAAFAAMIRRQTPVSQLCPFNTNREALGAMFKGRRAELATLIEDLSTSVALQGARRIGKTSLLRQGYTSLRNRYLSEGRQRVFYFNCLTWASYSHACYMLAHKIDIKRELRVERGSKNIEYMLERCSHGGTKPLYLFFDEVDALIDLDAAQDWPFFRLLAWAKDEGFVRFVLAGFRSISRLVYGQHEHPAHRRSGTIPSTTITESPLLLALETITLNPLTRKEADQLLIEPMKSTEMQIQNEPDVLNRVWKGTSGYPFLVQFFGQHLFKIGAERNPPSISVEDVAEVEESAKLHEFLETHFIENTLQNGIPVSEERICAFLFAHAEEANWTEQDFWEACRQYQVPLGLDGLGTIHRAVKSLCDAQVLVYTHSRYAFAFPVMRTILTTSYPDVHKAIRALTGA